MNTFEGKQHKQSNRNKTPPDEVCPAELLFQIGQMTMFDESIFRDCEIEVRVKVKEALRFDFFDEWLAPTDEPEPEVFVKERNDK